MYKSELYTLPKITLVPSYLQNQNQISYLALSTRLLAGKRLEVKNNVLKGLFIEVLKGLFIEC